MKLLRAVGKMLLSMSGLFCFFIICYLISILPAYGACCSVVIIFAVILVAIFYHCE